MREVWRRYPGSYAPRKGKLNFWSANTLYTLQDEPKFFKWSLALPSADGLEIIQEMPLGERGELGSPG